MNRETSSRFMLIKFPASSLTDPDPAALPPPGWKPPGCPGGCLEVKMSPKNHLSDPVLVAGGDTRKTEGMGKV